MLKMVQKSSQGVTASVNTTVPYNATIDQFISALGIFGIYTQYNISGVLIMTDTAGVVTTDQTLAQMYCWRIMMNTLRPTDIASLKPSFTSVDGTGTLSVTIVQPHCPTLSGTFLLNMGGVFIITSSGNASIPFNVTAADLQSGFNKIVGFENVQV